MVQLQTCNQRYPFFRYKVLEDITIVCYSPMMIHAFKEARQSQNEGEPLHFEFTIFSDSHAMQMEIMEQKQLQLLHNQIEEKKLNEPDWKAPTLKFAYLEINGEKQIPRYIFDREGGPILNEGFT